MKKSAVLNVTIPAEMLEILDLYAEYEGLTRSGAVGYLLARGLSYESDRTNGFDFDSPFDVYTKENGETIVLKRSDLHEHKIVEWIMSCGRNRRKETVMVSDKDFKEVTPNNELDGQVSFDDTTKND